MTVRPSFADLVHAQEGWDAAGNDNFSIIEDTPIPIARYSNPATIPTASQYDQCVAVINDATAGWILTVSNALIWRKVPVQATAQVDSTATTVADLRTDLNLLLARFRVSGTIAP